MTGFYRGGLYSGFSATCVANADNKFCGANRHGTTVTFSYSHCSGRSIRPTGTTAKGLPCWSRPSDDQF